MTRTIVVGGAARSGKTTLATLLSAGLGIPHANIGDSLRDALSAAGAPPIPRRSIGAEYIARFGFESYVRHVVSMLEAGVVLDGLRHREPLLRCTKPYVIVCRGAPPCRDEEDASWERGAEGVCASADFTVPWQPSREMVIAQSVELVRKLGREAAP